MLPCCSSVHCGNSSILWALLHEVSKTGTVGVAAIIWGPIAQPDRAQAQATCQHLGRCSGVLRCVWLRLAPPPGGALPSGCGCAGRCGQKPGPCAMLSLLSAAAQPHPCLQPVWGPLSFFKGKQPDDGLDPVMRTARCVRPLHHLHPHPCLCTHARPACPACPDSMTCGMRSSGPALHDPLGQVLAGASHCTEPSNSRPPICSFCKQRCSRVSMTPDVILIALHLAVQPCLQASGAGSWAARRCSSCQRAASNTSLRGH